METLYVVPAQVTLNSLLLLGSLGAKPKEYVHRWARHIVRHPRYGPEVVHICKDCNKVAYTSIEPDPVQGFPCGKDLAHVAR